MQKVLILLRDEKLTLRLCGRHCGVDECGLGCLGQIEVFKLVWFKMFTLMEMIHGIGESLD